MEHFPLSNLDVPPDVFCSKPVPSPALPRFFCFESGSEARLAKIIFAEFGARPRPAQSRSELAPKMPGGTLENEWWTVVKAVVFS